METLSPIVPSIYVDEELRESISLLHKFVTLFTLYLSHLDELSSIEKVEISARSKKENCLLVKCSITDFNLR